MLIVAIGSNFQQEKNIPYQLILYRIVLLHAPFHYDEHQVLLFFLYILLGSNMWS